MDNLHPAPKNLTWNENNKYIKNLEIKRGENLFRTELKDYKIQTFVSVLQIYGRLIKSQCTESLTYIESTAGTFLSGMLAMLQQKKGFKSLTNYRFKETFTISKHRDAALVLSQIHSRRSRGILGLRWFGTSHKKKKKSPRKE